MFPTYLDLDLSWAFGFCLMVCAFFSCALVNVINSRAIYLWCWIIVLMYLFISLIFWYLVVLIVC